MTIETTPEAIRKTWVDVTAIIGYGCLALGAVSAVIYCLRRIQKQEVEDVENISAAKDGDGSPKIRQNNKYVEESDFLLSRQDEKNISAAKDGDGLPKIMKKTESAELSDFLLSLQDAHLNNRCNSKEDKEDLEIETVI